MKKSKNLLLSQSPKTLIIPIILFIFSIFFKSFKLFFLSLLSLAFLFYFFRVPDIRVSKGLNSILSPASGKIINIVQNDKFIHFSIFLGILNPHVQYIPYDGYLSNTSYMPGTFKFAYLFKKSNYNERKIYNFVTRLGLISVIQIAGLLGRRLVSFIEPKTFVKKGMMLGMIKFGSRVDIIIPYLPQMSINKQVGDVVKGGESILVKLSGYNF